MSACPKHGCPRKQLIRKSGVKDGFMCAKCEHERYVRRKNNPIAREKHRDRAREAARERRAEGDSYEQEKARKRALYALRTKPPKPKPVAQDPPKLVRTWNVVEQPCSYSAAVPRAGDLDWMV